MNDTTKETLERLREAAKRYAQERTYASDTRFTCSVITDICDRALTTKEAKGWKDGVPDALKIKEPEAKPKMMVCENAEECKDRFIISGCNKPHLQNRYCTEGIMCTYKNKVIKCIPVSKPTPEEKRGDRTEPCGIAGHPTSIYDAIARVLEKELEQTGR